ncbi:TlpA family protein disulfide reductase [Pedobacter nyackensis]|uniref:Thiol-disulfide isomerase or thioredoxin n=1 Tax=Pedobacter nyackensis TaxID=475255 RepID=A0A1W2CQ86_9SPHI|nr:TlpA disulfide reductase family protein [Pedobacter nyackensis]SMC87379.1 Thiol-disulfide isomerase or thioredoxin [Pedobacter nyackensis]
MNKIFAIAAVLCGLAISPPTFAEDGAKTVIKGQMSSQQGGASLFIEGFGLTQKGRTNYTNGSFIMETTFNEPTFCILTTTDPIVKGFNVYLKPGDDILITVKGNQVVLSGKGSKLNQFLFDIINKYNYKDKQYTAKEVYTNRVNAINASADAEVKLNKAALLGHAQGEYLDKVFGPYMESKVAGEVDEINKAKFDDFNLNLVPEIVSYYNWFKTINEIMYAKMEAGKLTVRNSNTWIADFAKTIGNQELREAYVVKLVDFALMEEDVFKVKNYAKEAMPLLKDPSNISKINAITGRVDKLTRYNNAVPGTDFSQATFLKPDGTKAKISDYKGRYILIDIWSTWCHPCVAEMPFLKKLEHEMEGKDVVFLSLNGDVKEEYWQNFMKKRNLTGNQIKMEKGLKDDPFFYQIGVTGIPRFAIIDKEGKMVNAKCCQRPSNPVLKVYLNELLSK